MIFNGISKDYLTVTRGRKRPAWATVEREFVTASGMPGAHLFSTNTQVRTITVPVFILAENFSNLQKLKEDMAEWLIHPDAKELIFKDEPDRVYFAVVDGDLDLDEMVRWGEGEITFVCHDPYKYSKEEKKVSAEDITIINNEGNEPTEPIVELTATKKATFAMISKPNDEYNLLGYPLEEEGQEEVVDSTPVVLSEDGTSIDGWTTSGVQVDDHFNDITGTMMSDGSGIRVNSRGTPTDRMNGPAMIKEIPRPLQDFEIITNFDIISRREMDNFRIEVYFFDEAMNMLGKIGIKDNSRSKNRRAALGRVGPYRGGGKKNGYAIGKHNYVQDNLGQTTLMNMSVKREGNLYTFYVAKFLNSRHRTTLRSTFRDTKNEYDGRLRYVALYLGNYQDRASPNRLRMNNLVVKELKQLTVDQTPYILDVGDTVTFDHSTEEILINGQDAMMIKDFGAEFFKLPKGHSQIEINPPDTFTGEIKFREKYK